MIDRYFTIELADGSVLFIETSEQGEPIVRYDDLPKTEMVAFSEHNPPSGMLESRRLSKRVRQRSNGS